MRRLRTVAFILGLAGAATLDLDGVARAEEKSISEEAKKEAMQKFEAGSKAFAEKRYKDAIDLFLDADASVQNADLAYNTSLAYEAMGDASSALAWAREYLRRAPSAEDRATVEARIAKFERKLQEKGVQQLTVLSAPGGATVRIDGRPVGVTPWTGDLRPGSHTVSLVLEGHDPAETVFPLRPERAGELKLELVKATESLPSPLLPAPSRPEEPAPKPADPTVRWGLLGGGIAAAALGAGGVAAAIGLELMRGSAEEDARLAPIQVDASTAYDQMLSYQLGARVAAGVGAGLLAIGATMIGIGGAMGTDESAPAVTVGCAPAGCSFLVGGAF